LLIFDNKERASVLAERRVALDLLVEEPAHHDFELFECDHSVAVDIDLLDNLIEDALVTELLANAENLLDLLSRD